MRAVSTLVGFAALSALALGHAEAEPASFEIWTDDAGHRVPLARAAVRASTSPTIDRDRATLRARRMLSTQLGSMVLRGSRVVWERRYDDPECGCRMHVVVIGIGDDLRSVAAEVIDYLNRQWYQRQAQDGELDGVIRGSQ